MRIGILSDSHGRTAAVVRAIDLLRGGGAEFFIHCGDVGSEQVLDLLAGLPAAFVTGNTDYDRDALLRYGRAIGVEGYIPSADLTLGGKRIAVTHGDDGRLLQRLVVSQDYDYVLHGHTHLRRDERHGRTRILNPGALHRALTKSVALLDTESDDVRFLTVED